MYSQYIPSKFLNNVFLKFENTFHFLVFKKKTAYLFDGLLDYKYIYTAAGDSVYKDFSQEHPEFIKDHDLVFTNKK